MFFFLFLWVFLYNDNKRRGAAHPPKQDAPTFSDRLCWVSPRVARRTRARAPAPGAAVGPAAKGGGRCAGGRERRLGGCRGDRGSGASVGRDGAMGGVDGASGGTGGVGELGMALRSNPFPLLIKVPLKLKNGLPSVFCV